MRQYLPHEVKVKLEGATMLHLQENRNFSNEFMDRLKSLLGGMMKPRTLRRTSNEDCKISMEIDQGTEISGLGHGMT